MEGFRVKLLKEDNLFEWEVAIFGPPETLFAGGYFRAIMKFPQDYPFSPPSVKFITKILHPNVYDNGTVCISILHPPTPDPRSGELPSERWNPTQNVHSILMSIISLLNEPNTSSPANVDASVMYRKWKEKGDKAYENMVKEQVQSSKADAARDGVVVPQTVEEYCIKKTPVKKEPSLDMNDYFQDDYDDDDALSEDEEPTLMNPDNAFTAKRKEDEKAIEKNSSETTNKRSKPTDSTVPDRT